MNLNFSRGLKTAKSVITANSPVLLVGAAVAGVVATGVLAARGGYKARGIVDAAQAEVEEPLTVQTKVKLTWLCYVPAALTGVTTIASCLGVHMIHTKRHAALVGLYAAVSGKADDYREKAEELLGTKKTQQLRDVLGQEAVDSVDMDDAVIVEGGTELMLDMWTQRPIKSNMNKIDAAVNECNSMLIDEGELDLNTWYDRIGLPGIPSGDDMGWNGGQRIAVQYGAAIDRKGRPVITISFRHDPRPALGKS